MNRTRLPHSLREALALTQTGRLVDATRAIQAALGAAQGGETEGARPRAPRLEAPEAGSPRTDARTRPARPLRPLGEVVSALRKGRRAFDTSAFDRPAFEQRTRRGSRPTPTPLPDGARFEVRAFSSPAGSRAYKLFVPAGPAASRPLGLVLMLHGCTQDPDDFAAGTDMNTLAQEHGLLVAYPAQPRSANASGCWNWFAPEHQTRDAGEPAILAGLARSIAAEFGIADGRVFAAGLSAGGAMAALLGRAFPELFSGIGIHSGLPAGAASDVVSAFAAMRGEGVATDAGAVDGPRTIVFHGAADRTVHPSNAERIAAGMRRVGRPEAEETGSAGGRRFRRTRVTDGRVGTLEVWTIDGAGHAWSGGHASGAYADPAGPNASREMIRFFLEG